MNNQDKPWWERFLGPGDRERINEAIKQQLSDGRSKPFWRIPDSLRDSKELVIGEIVEFPTKIIKENERYVLNIMQSVNINPDIVVQQKNCIAELVKELETLHQQIRCGLYYQRPCALGTKVYCIINNSVVKGYVHSYEDMFNIQTKDVIRVIKIALIGEDGIVHKALSEFRKTVFLNEAEALAKIK